MADVTGGAVKWILDIDNRGFDDGLKKARNDVKATVTSVDNQTSSMGNKIANIFKGVGTAIANSVKVGAIAAGSQITALGAFGLKSGAELQKTAISMNNLTKSAEVGAKVFSDLYQFALKSPFAFPEVAQAGKTLIGFGISAEKVVKNVELLGNISASTGTELTSLASIFGQISAAGRLTTEDINQLTENGIAILPALQKQFGKTAEEIRDMATEGEISATQFQKALESLVSPTAIAEFENTLPRALSSLQGALRNLAFSFVGIDITSGFKAQADGLYQATINSVKQIASALRAPELQASFATLGRQLTGVVAQIAPLIAPLISTLGQVAVPLITFVAGAIGGFASLLQAALPGLNVFFQSLNASLQALLPLVSQVGATLGQALGQVLASLAPVLPVIAQALGQVLQAILPIIPPLATFISQLVTSLAPILPPLAQALVSLVAPITQVLAPILPVITNLVSILASTFTQILQSLLPLLPPLVQLAVTIFQQVIAPILPGIVQLFTLLASAFLQVLQALLPVLPTILQLTGALVSALAPVLPTLVGLFIQLVQAILPILPPLVELTVALLPLLISFLTILIQVAGSVAQVFLAAFTGAISLVIQVFRQLVLGITGVIEFFGLLFSKVSTFGTKIYSAIAEKIGGVIGIFRDLPGRVLSHVGNLGSTLYNAGRDLINGLLNGAGSVLSNIGKFFLDKVPDFIKGPFKAALGIKSPSKVFAGYGVNIGEGLIQGINSSKSMVGRAITDLNTAIVTPMPEFNASLTAPDTTGENVVSSSRPSATINQTNNIYNQVDMDAGWRDLSWRLAN